jgi:RimJ/RimL family protein N-acetyltransferase
MPAPPPLIARARELWQSLAGAGAEFTPALRVAVSPLSRLCPRGWAGIVVISDAVIATAPDHETARHMEQALRGLAVASLTDLTDLAVLSGRLRIAEMRGPATLAYLDPADFRPQPAAALARPMDLDDPAFRRFLSGASTADLEESGLAEITSPAFTIREHGDVVAAAGYRDWPCRTAHLSILTAAPARSRGLARAAASAAVTRAISDDRLPQWRATVPASRRIALALGFRELGSQASISIATAHAG